MLFFVLKTLAEIKKRSIFALAIRKRLHDLLEKWQSGRMRQS